MDKKMLTTNDIVRRLITRHEIREGNLDAMVKTITERSADYLGADRVSVWLNASNTDFFCAKDIYRADTKTHGTATMISLDAYHNLQNVLYTERYLAAEDLEKDSRTAQAYKGLWKKEEIKSAIFVPIILRGYIKGFMQIDFQKTTRFTSDQVNFSIQMVDMLTRTILNNKLVKRDKKLSLMTNYFQATTTQQTSDLTDWVARLVNLVDAETGMVFLIDRDSKVLRCKTAVNTDFDFSDLRLNFGQDAAGIAAETNAAILVENYMDWQFASKNFKTLVDIHSVIAVPLAANETVHAVALLVNKRDAKNLTNQDLELAKLFVNQTKATVVQYDVVRTKKLLKRQTHITRDIMEVANTVTTIPHLLQVAKSVLTDRMNAPIVALAYDDILTTVGTTKTTATEIINLIHADVALNSTVLISDTSTYKGALKPAVTRLAKNDARSAILSARKITGGETLTLLLAAPQEDIWTAYDVNTINQVVDLMATQMSRLIINEQMILQETLMIKMRDVGQSLNRLINFDDAVTIIGREAFRLLDAHAGLIMLEDENGVIDIPWVEGVNTQKYQKIIRDEISAMRSTFMTANYPATIKDIPMLNLPANVQALFTMDQILTIQTVPFVYNDRVIGVMLTLFDKVRIVDAAELRILNMFANQASLTIRNARMYEELENGYIDVVLALAKTVDEREMTISDASLRIADLAEKAARRLGLPEEEIRDLHWAALLHDVGKVDVSKQVLQKPGSLNKTEWAEIKKHPVKGEEMIQPISRFKNVGRIIRNFREKYDGSGYPDKLKGSQIPVAARVLCVADAYESMLTDRSYKKAFTTDEALAELEKNAGTQFDPLVVQTFMETVKESITVN